MREIEIGTLKIKAENNTLKIKIGGNQKTITDRGRKPFNRIKTTKYTLLTFLPLNLVEQFRRLTYFYYLIVTILSFFVNNTISPFTALIPLLFVILVSAVKQGREEFLRYRADKIVNNCQVKVLRKGEKFYIPAQYIAPGDLVLVERDSDVPCDLVILHTSDGHGKCFVTTVNLDGETNLKMLLVPRQLKQLKMENLDQLGVIECEQSKTDIYSFNGKIHLNARSNESLDAIPLGAEHLLLSGARIKNTEYIIGCAIYTGMKAKLQLNSRLTSNKAASSEGYINRYLIFLVIFMIALATTLYFLERHDELFVVPLMSYLGPPVDVNRLAEIFEDYFSFLVIVNYMIPISMYMNIELYRVFGALFLNWDRELYDGETDQPCLVNTQNLIEELGQINFLFSDKTGTLTKNEMYFQRCSIQGTQFVFKCGLLQNNDKGTVIDITKFDQHQMIFFEALAICHTVQVVRNSECDGFDKAETDHVENNHGEKSLLTTKAGALRKASTSQTLKTPRNSFQQEDLENDNVVSSSSSKASFPLYAEPSCQDSELHQSYNFAGSYQASSLDEKAFVEACAQLGLVYLGDEDETLRFARRTEEESQTKEFQFKRLHILEFTPERKRMSVIVEDSNQDKWIYSKGAENVIFPLCSNYLSKMANQTDEHITEFSKLGLRTLAIARRHIPELEYEEFCKTLSIANNSLDQRKQLTENCYANIEKDLQVLGATAVEDVLQDDVAETLSLIQKAGLKIWVLTGDKVETALNIAIACGHIPAQAKQYSILSDRGKDNISNCLNTLEMELHKGNQCALLIDGESLAIVLQDIPDEFRKIAINCCAVLCCRLSPLQKSQVIALVKKSTEKFITAAIGDGANDVSMIQEADVGIGIIGKEGRQAARSADFAISKFSMLKQLLLVHGHYNTTRLSFLVLFYCYKNIVMTGIMFLFQCHSLFSGTSVYHSQFLLLFDILYISGGMTCVTLFERPFSQETLLRQPELYKLNGNNRQVRWSVFLTWMLNAVYQALVIYFLAYYALTTNDVLWNNGQTADFYCFGTLLFQIVIIVENLKLLLSVKLLSYWLIGIVFASIFILVLSTLTYNLIFTSTGLFWIYKHFLSSIPVWIFTILATVTSLLPDLTYALIHRLIN